MTTLLLTPIVIWFQYQCLAASCELPGPMFMHVKVQPGTLKHRSTKACSFQVEQSYRHGHLQVKSPPLMK